MQPGSAEFDLPAMAPSQATAVPYLALANTRGKPGDRPGKRQ
jgi:hypothetical protein